MVNHKYKKNYTVVDSQVIMNVTVHHIRKNDVTFLSLMIG